MWKCVFKPQFAMKHNRFHISNINYDGFLPNMSAQLFLQSAILSKEQTPQVTFEWFLSRNNRFQSVILSKPQSIHVTFEWFHSRNKRFQKCCHNPHIWRGFSCMIAQYVISNCHFFLPKHNPHLSHLNGFSPISVRKYIFKLIATHNSQCWRVSLKCECTHVFLFYRRQRNSHIISYFTGWWERNCIFKRLFRAKCKPHKSLWNGLTTMSAQMPWAVFTVIVPLWAKHNTHASHVKSSTPVWVHKCFFKALLRAKNNSHIMTFEMFLSSMSAQLVFNVLLTATRKPHNSHLTGFSPVWMRMCFFKVSLRAKHKPHISHLNGFSPVWMRKWLFKVLFAAKHKPHRSHLKGFCPLWLRTCVFKVSLRAKHKPHISYLNCFSSVWVRKLLFKE